MGELEAAGMGRVGPLLLALKKEEGHERRDVRSPWRLGKGSPLKPPERNPSLLPTWLWSSEIRSAFRAVRRTCVVLSHFVCGPWLQQRLEMDTAAGACLLSGHSAFRGQRGRVMY